MNKFIQFLLLCLISNLLSAQTFKNSVTSVYDEAVNTNNYSTNSAFGSDIEIDGEWMVVGDRTNQYDETGANPIIAAGSASIYRKISGVWTYQQKIVGPDRQIGDFFGWNVAIRGDIMVIGSNYNDTDQNGLNVVTDAGAAYVFRLSGSTWVFEQKLVAPSADRESNERFGSDVEVHDNNRILIGAFFEDSDELGAGYNGGQMGAVYSYTYSGSTWSMTQKIIPPNPYNGLGFGNSLDIYNNTLVIGAPYDNYDEMSSAPIAESGSIFIYELIAGTWTFTQKKCPTIRTLGQRYGFSVAIYGDHIVVGAQCDDFDANELNPFNCAGAAFSLHYDGMFWVQDEKFSHPNTRNSIEDMGVAVDITDRFVVVGSANDYDEFNAAPLNAAGNYIVYKINPDHTYTLMEVLDAPDREALDLLGYSIAFDSNYLVGGAQQNKHHATGITVGRIYFYELNDIPYLDFIDPITGTQTSTGIPDTTICSNDTLIFDLNLTDENPSSVILSAQSSNVGLIPLAGITFSGSGATRTISVNPVNTLSGSSQIIITATDNLGQENSDTFNITVNAFTEVTAAYTVLDTLCNGQLVISAAGIPASGMSYTWSTGYVNASDFLITNTTDFNSIVFGTDINGCSDTASLFVDNSLYPTNNVNLEFTDTTVCIGTNGEVLMTGSDLNTYSSAHFLNGSNIPMANLVTGVLFPVNSDTLISIVLEDSYGSFTCSDTFDLMVDMITGPAIPTNFVSNNILICGTGQDTVQIGATSLDGNGYVFGWSPNTDMLNSASSTPSVWPAITTTYVVSVTDPVTGCTSTQAGDVSVTDPTSVSFALENDSLFIFQNGTGSLNVLSNDLISGTPGVIVEIYSPTIIDYTFSGSTMNYTAGTLLGIDSLVYEICDLVCINICDQAVVYIEVREFVPFTPGNFGISPNGDGNGDLFVFEGLENYPNNRVQIFNRWGQLIYSSEPYNNDWQGTNTSGNAISEGTYFYILEVEINGVWEKFNGYIEILK